MIPPFERLFPEVRAMSVGRATPAQIWNDGLALMRARWYLRRATSVGERPRVWGRPVIRNLGSLIIGQRVTLFSTAIPIQLTTEADGTLEIGARTFMNYGCSILATKLVSIGPDCKLGMDVLMMDNDFHQIDPAKRWVRPSSAPVVLEENVWLGARVIVLSGVRIGANSVVAAGSVVTRDIPPYSLAAGQPARVIRSIDR
ncbi:acyltransferase [Hyphomicrobium sp.]|jgi:maltose O-acetyltransferase|uniref:acyltransferase n=1 Tax=Hyphomicrobium sp. TaxID=82 RepID=UPI00356176C7